MFVGEFLFHWDGHYFPTSLKNLLGINAMVLDAVKTVSRRDSLVKFTLARKTGTPCQRIPRYHENSTTAYPKVPTGFPESIDFTRVTLCNKVVIDNFKWVGRDIRRKFWD